MVNPRKPFRLNVGFLISQEVGYSHEFPFAFEKTEVSDDLTLRNLEGLVTIGRTPQGLFVQGEFAGQMPVQCARCLTAFEHELHWDFTELYAFDERSITDSGLILPDDAHIDLAPLIRDFALLEIPINPICRADCRGLCPVCGENLNERDCGHRPAADESPFSVLKKLL